MSDYLITQADRSLRRQGDVAEKRKSYLYDLSTGLPLGKYPDIRRERIAPEWIRQLLQVAIRIRANMKSYMNVTPFSFARQYPPDITNPDFLRFALGGITTANESMLQNIIDSGSNIAEVILPDMGPAGSVHSIDEYRDLWVSLPLPEIAGRFESDESFAHTFVAGPNPGIIQRMTKVTAAFPISNVQLQSVPEFKNDDLAQAMREGRIYLIDHSDMKVLKNGSHYNESEKYTYAPFAAFAIPRAGGRLYPFAIQCGPSPEGRLIYTPNDGYSWKIAKNCVLVAHNIHHELSTHLGLTHYLMDPILMATRRQLDTNHPIFALLKHHFEGTAIINFSARTNLVQPTRAVDRLVGCNLPSAYEFLKNSRLNYSFSGNYLPRRFERLQTLDSKLFSVYPYRDDGLLLWNAILEWANDFVRNFYKSDADVRGDQEIQNWAAEIASPSGGMVKEFGQTPGSIKTREDLIEILTMIMFTAGPQHAAVNFAQLSDMAFAPANPLAGFTPEPRGKGHTEQDWLANLPPIEYAVTAINILNMLGSIYYTRLGHYSGKHSGVMEDFDKGPIKDAVKNFQANLESIESLIEQRNTRRRIPYVHLLPSRIPQSVNI